MAGAHERITATRIWLVARDAVGSAQAGIGAAHASPIMDETAAYAWCVEDIHLAVRS